MAGPLGCGLMGAYLVPRESPRTILADLSKDVVPGSRCSRVLNSVSSATISVAECYDGPEIIPWYHSLLLSWDLDWFWYGPIVDVTDQSDGTGMIEAFDLMKWMAFRLMRDDFTSIGAPVDITTIFQDLINKTREYATRAHLHEYTSPCIVHRFDLFHKFDRSHQVFY